MPHNKSIENSYIHKGHRKRMIARFLKEGLDGFQQHEALELTLFFAIPQQNTNPIGHDLIKTFGSISGVFDADFNALMQVKGIKEHSATLIKLIPQLCAYYQADKNKPGEKFESIEEIAKFCMSKYMALSEERLSVVMFDASQRLLGIETLAQGSSSAVELNIERLATLLFSKGCNQFLLVHNHPNGDLRPSSDDLYMTKKIELFFTTMNRHIIDHILIAGNRYLPIMSLPEYIGAANLSLKDFGF